MFKSKNRFAKVSLVLLVVASLSTVFAASPPTGAGQPNQSCEDAGVTPGHAASARGSAFNPDGVAGTMYAGQQPQNSVNPNAVSQYDVACFQVSIH